MLVSLAPLVDLDATWAKNPRHAAAHNVYNSFRRSSGDGTSSAGSRFDRRIKAGLLRSRTAPRSAQRRLSSQRRS